MEVALASSSFHLDDDDFDWEAAVREIDVACHSGIPSTSNDGEVAPIPPPTTCPSLAEPRSRTRQSTLDRFVSSFEKGNADGYRPSKFRLLDPTDDACRDKDVPYGGRDETPAVKIDLEAVKTWIYPVNIPVRNYQFAIAESALFSNTLVALPTGLGKTLIAAVVMYNYFRWFPEGKIVFTAPSKPLVMQQIQACHKIVGMPQESTIDMTGQTSPSKRSRFWKAKRVFFVTPQVLEKDIQSGICLVDQLVCLIIDEAHRALGNYSYCVIVRQLMAIPVELRILALTATPGSKHQTIQNVIDNLHISTLEYRHETDRDVSPYVHNRKLELIEVPMGKDAVEIDNLLLQAMEPFGARLSATGVLPHRNLTTFSPCELLNLRDKFRQARPHNILHSKYGEVEGLFSVLITFYHVRKVLSSHGIRPACEMLNDRLDEGRLLKFVSKNEAVWKIKGLMQQFMSHGAPSPKLVKMLDVLVDHFKTKGPGHSRIIIFSNFRGSVRDILDSLTSLGDLVKATEFVGQSSGKTLKGQTQKVQQAVLEKFRAGVYNVIVATSIGEEGLDIMEVDLVICFDANVSPLRMIQRMGRTGRKNEGRVVVLACEGSELKSYLKKQASSKAVRKHMHNGGVVSFNFHPSPRMVPHIFKPEVQCVEMSIDQFIPRWKKRKNDTMDRSTSLKNISNAEHILIDKYFHQSEDVQWKPSLISFPSFQAFPSGVNIVGHSFKTSVFIGAMQVLQGTSFSKVKNEGFVKVETESRSFSKITASHHNTGQGSFNFIIPDVADAPFKVSPNQTSEPDATIPVCEQPIQKRQSHRFLFSEGFVSVNSLGSVLIAYVPVLQQNGCKGSIVMTDNSCLRPPCRREASDFPTMQLDVFGYLIDQENENGASETHSLKQKFKDLENCVTDKYCNVEDAFPAASVNRPGNTLIDMELSPRLTHLIEEGIVPESPMPKLDCRATTEKEISTVYVSKDDEYSKMQSNNLVSNLLVQSDVVVDAPCQDKPLLTHHYLSPHINRISCTSSNEINICENERLRLQSAMNGEKTEKMMESPLNEAVQTPLANATSRSSSEDWKLNSGEASNSFFQAPKYKRLRKYGDVVRKLPVKALDERYDTVEAAFHVNPEKDLKPSRGKKKREMEHVQAFIEVEAEVSEDATVSQDEVLDERNDKYDDSFIDDRINTTEGSLQAENNGDDMMAFYRRSLLSQSSPESPRKYLAASRESISSGTVGSCSSEKVHDPMETPLYRSQSLNQLNGSSSVIRGVELGNPERYSNKLDSRKRKLTFQPADIIPEESSQLQTDHAENASFDHLGDDEFYQALDLDEVEAQATKLLQVRSEIPSSKTQTAFNDHSAPIHTDVQSASSFMCSPSFDLGI